MVVVTGAGRLGEPGVGWDPLLLWGPHAIRAVNVSWS